MIFTWRLIFFKLKDASSAISSSDIMHFSISLFKLVRGSMDSNKSSKLSLSASSFLEKVLTRRATFKRELMLRSSPTPKVLPISRRLRDSPMSLMPENDTLPFCQIRFKASSVSNWFFLISFKSLDGLSSLHSIRPKSLPASSLSMFIILLYSSVFNTFSFITKFSNSCI